MENDQIPTTDDVLALLDKALGILDESDALVPAAYVAEAIAALRTGDAL